jgi:hypothetical protein
MELPWNICPYCATPVPGVRLENITTTEPVIENSEILSTFESGLEENVEDPDRAQSDSDWISLRRAGNEGPQPETQPPAA